MVSTIWKPETVAAASLPASRIWTRVILTRLAAMICETIRFSMMVEMPIIVRITLFLSMRTRYTIIMTMFSKRGASISTRVVAMDAFALCRCKRSPESRWEKKSMGSRRSFHMYSLLPTAAILPLILSA